MTDPDSHSTLRVALFQERAPELGKGWVQIVRTLPIASAGGTQNLNGEIKGSED